MPYVAFVRNVTLGRKAQSNDALVRAFLDAGATEAESFLASGNVTFETPEVPAAVASRARDLLRERIGFGEPSYVRSVDGLARWVESDPFQDEPGGEVNARFVTFLPEHSPGVPAVPISSDREDVTVFAFAEGAAFSVTYTIGGRQGNATALLERLFGVGLTTRNWNTVRRIVAKYA